VASHAATLALVGWLSIDDFELNLAMVPRSYGIKDDPERTQLSKQSSSNPTSAERAVLPFTIHRSEPPRGLPISSCGGIGHGADQVFITRGTAFFRYNTPAAARKVTLIWQ
jgi:hypothetical protein